jgi:hypothetical protein
MPEVYEYLEAERIKYAIRLPANQVLQNRIGYLLKRPVGRPPNEVRRYCANFTYQAGSWIKPRRVIAKVEWHPGELYPRVGFIVTNMSRPAERVVDLQQARHCQAVDQGRQGCDQVDAAVMPDVRRQSSASAASCIGLQSRQLLAHAGDAGTDQGLVAVEPEREADQDRRQGHQPWPQHCLPDGRGRHSQATVPGDFAADCRAAAEAAARTSMRLPMVMRSTAPDGKTTPRCRGKTDSSAPRNAAPGPDCTRPPTNRVGPSGKSRKPLSSAPSSGFIWGIQVQSFLDTSDKVVLTEWLV